MPELTISQYQGVLREAGKLVPSARTIKREIASGRLGGYKKPGPTGRYVVDPDRPISDTTQPEGMGMGGNRLRIHDGLPPNLYKYKKSDTWYFRYKIPEHIKNIPENERWQPLGSNESKAIDAANQFNQKFGKGSDLVAQVYARLDSIDRHFGRYVQKFLTQILPARRVGKRKEPMSPNTITEYTRICNDFLSIWNEKYFPEITQAIIAEYLNKQVSAAVYNKHRTVLGLIWKYAISDGLIEDKVNLPLAIVKRDGEKTKRHRLTLEGYQAIFEHASFAVQSAMELSINCIQRRSDIRIWKFDDTLDNGMVRRIVSKTKSRGMEAYIMIPITLPLIHSERGCKTLKELINSCRDNVPSPYLVHHKPYRRKLSKQKDHWTQLSKEEISNGFADARESSAFYQKLPPEERPTLHECIALGEHLMGNAGYDEKWIQLLRGHQKIETTRLYLEDHEWTVIPMPC